MTSSANQINEENSMYDIERDERVPYKFEPTDYAPKSSKLPLSEQEKLIAVLNETISELADRLSPVLEPDYPQESAQTSNEAKDKEGSPLGEQMKANNRGIGRAGTRLRGLIERLEC